LFSNERLPRITGDLKGTDWQLLRRRLQVLAVLDIVYLASCVYKPYKVLRDTLSPGAPSVSQPGQRHSYTFTHAMLYVELLARGLASVSQTAIVWLVVMVTIDRYLAVCQPLRGYPYDTIRDAILTCARKPT